MNAVQPFLPGSSLQATISIVLLNILNSPMTTNKQLTEQATEAAMGGGCKQGTIAFIATSCE